ncbi:MAG: hypothetical protein AAF821_18845 [Cyanobacteria bacterium P01_D01_bin.156]
MDDRLLNSVQGVGPSTTIDAIVQLLQRLPLQTQRQVLDFVEFLLHRHQLSESVHQSEQDDLDEEIALWEAASDEDWIATEEQLVTKENG